MMTAFSLCKAAAGGDGDDAYEDVEYGCPARARAWKECTSHMGRAASAWARCRARQIFCASNRGNVILLQQHWCLRTAFAMR
jgi:hypothetical protein